MRTKVGSTVHPRYKGVATWQVNGIAGLSQPIEYSDPVQGQVSYDPRILLLECPEHGKVLWFAYWISTSKTRGRVKWGQGPPMLEENVLLKLLEESTRQGLFSRDFLKGLVRESQRALTGRKEHGQSDPGGAVIEFDRQRHRFRGEIRIVYSQLWALVRGAYGDSFAKEFAWNRSGTGVGYLSNMAVVYVWTIFEELMRNAFIAVHGTPLLGDDDLMHKNYGWGKMTDWLSNKNMFTDNLKRFGPLVGELDARRNCLVHRNGVVDQIYIDQACRYGSEPAFRLGRRVWTSWDYHQQLETQLFHFQNSLGAEVGKCLGWGNAGHE